MKKLWVITLILAGLLVAACGSTPAPAPTEALPAPAPTEALPAPAPTQAVPTVAPTDTTLVSPLETTMQSPLDMPNPASTYCVDQGYSLEIRDEAGGQVGYCVFPDGTECEEWAFYRGECSAP